MTPKQILGYDVEEAAQFIRGAYAVHGTLDGAARWVRDMAALVWIWKYRSKR